MTQEALNKANYIILLIKSVGKSKEEAIDRAGWYTCTDLEQKQVEEYINNNF